VEFAEFYNTIDNGHGLDMVLVKNPGIILLDTMMPVMDIA